MFFIFEDFHENIFYKQNCEAISKKLEDTVIFQFLINSNNFDKIRFQRCGSGSRKLMSQSRLWL